MNGGSITYEKPKNEFLTLSGIILNHSDDQERTNTLIYTLKGPEFNEENSDKICDYVEQNVIPVTKLPDKQTVSLETGEKSVECNNGELKIKIPITLTYNGLLYSNYPDNTFEIGLCLKDKTEQYLCSDTLKTTHYYIVNDETPKITLSSQRKFYNFNFRKSEILLSDLVSI